MRKLAIALLLLPTLALSAPEFVADGPTITIEPYGIESANYVCIPGNPYDAATLGYYNLYTGNESYAILIQPSECPTCDLGFAFSRVRMLLRLNAGAAFQISASIADVVDQGGGCYAPGAVQASSGIGAISGIATTGGYFINLTWASPCIDPGRPYFLIFSFPNLGTGVAGPYVDVNGVVNCESYRDAGAGWVDLVSAGFIGDPQIWAETDCCSAPVSDEGASWGGVKSLFR
ncbi:MAG: hypothetical protein IPK64_04795 [bacterium]|nr:hypothetical protein [bacterium]